jgi:hypothetical protein
MLKCPHLNPQKKLIIFSKELIIYNKFILKMKKNINKKLLKEEIDRFLEIMNIKLSNPILNESVSSVSLLKNFIVNAGKTEFDKLISSSASKNFLKVINRKYIQQSNDWSRTIDSLTETELAKLFATIDFDKLAKKIIENPNFTAVKLQ